MPIPGRAPDSARVADAIARWDVFELEDSANDIGLPDPHRAQPRIRPAHVQGSLLATQPVIGLERIGEAPPRKYTPSKRPFDGIPIRPSPMPAVHRGSDLGRTGSRRAGRDRPNDYEHEHIYAEANVGSRSAYIDLGSPIGQEWAASLLAEADVAAEQPPRGPLQRTWVES